MALWQNPLTLIWYQIFLYAFWDATRYNWDDPLLTWDAVNDNDFATKTHPTYQSKNSGDWKLKNSHTWQTAN